jgi:hypothetical protein
MYQASCGPTLVGMPSAPSPSPLSLARSVAAEVRAELARRGLKLNALDDVISSRGYVYPRLVAGTHAFTLNDVQIIEDFFGWKRLELMKRAYLSMEEEPSPAHALGPGFDSAEQAALDQLGTRALRAVTADTQRGTPRGDGTN